MKYLYIILSIFCGLPVYAQKLSKSEQQLVQQIDRNYKETLELLEKTVNINSGTFNLQGVREVGKVFEEEFAKIGFETTWVTLPDSLKRAGHFVATRKGTKGKKLFFIGHLDTVFEKDMPFYPFTMLNDSTAKGQGVNDMKGGNIMIFATLKALHELGHLKDRTVTVYFTGDEENAGSPSWVSRLDFVERAKQHDYALGYETAQGFSIATIARRGASTWTLTTSGKQVHSSGVFRESVGYGAIYEAARILDNFREALSSEQYLTFNPGQIIGGSDINYDPESGAGEALGKTNIVARQTLVKGDLRFLGEAQKEAAREKMKQIVAQHLNGTSASISFEDGIPSMPPTEANKALVNILDQVSKDMGYGAVQAGDPGSRGAGDISYVADFIACIDGLGASGTGAHSPSETINMKEYPHLIKRSTLFVYRLLQM